MSFVRGTRNFFSFPFPGGRLHRSRVPPALPLSLERLLARDRIAARRTRLSGERPVVILGRGKSGTRLLSLACDQLGVALGITPRRPAADIDHPPFQQAVKALGQRYFAANAVEAISAKDRQWFEYRAEQTWWFVRRHSPGSLAWGWKWPETYLITPLVYATFPRARFIHLVRDGRDVAFKRHLTDDVRRPLGRAILGHLGVTNEPRHIQAARSWQLQVDGYLRFAECIPPSQRLELSYEDLCRKPTDAAERISEFLQLHISWAAREWLKRNIQAHDVNQYRKASPDLVRDVEALIGPTLEKLGYALEHSSRPRA